MLAPITLNEQPAEATTPGGFGFVLTTARPAQKTNPAPDGLPATGFANLDYGEFDDTILQGLLPAVHTPTKEQPDARFSCRARSQL